MLLETKRGSTRSSLWRTFFGSGYGHVV